MQKLSSIGIGRSNQLRATHLIYFCQFLRFNLDTNLDWRQVILYRKIPRIHSTDATELWRSAEENVRHSWKRALSTNNNIHCVYWQ